MGKRTSDTVPLQNHLRRRYKSVTTVRIFNKIVMVYNVHQQTSSVWSLICINSLCSENTSACPTINSFKKLLFGERGVGQVEMAGDCNRFAAFEVQVCFCTHTHTHTHSHTLTHSHTQTHSHTLSLSLSLFLSLSHTYNVHPSDKIANLSSLFTLVLMNAIQRPVGRGAKTLAKITSTLRT